MRIVRSDFLGEDLSGADVVFFSPSPSVHAMILPNLPRELRDGAPVVTRTFEIADVEPTEVQEFVTVGGEVVNLYLYTRARLIAGLSRPGAGSRTDREQTS